MLSSRSTRATPRSRAGKLQFRSAAPREVFGHDVRRLLNRYGPSYPLPDHLRRREASGPVGLPKAGLPGRQAEVSGLVLPRAAAVWQRSWSAVRPSPAAVGCRPPLAARRPGFPHASLRLPRTGASDPSEPSPADPRAERPPGRLHSLDAGCWDGAAISGSRPPSSVSLNLVRLAEVPHASPPRNTGVAAALPVLTTSLRMDEGADCIRGGASSCERHYSCRSWPRASALLQPDYGS